MAVDHVALALMHLQDPDVRARVGTDDFSDLDDELTDEEREMLVGAADDDPEVEGFVLSESTYYPSLLYIAQNRSSLSPTVRATFTDYFNERWGGAWQIPIMG